ncbi:MAG: TIGR04255 family protein [Planctomycetota bacterium]
MPEPQGETSFKLRKAPVIEWWIRCNFFPREDGEPWDWNAALEFLRQYKDELPIEEHLPSFIPQAKPVKDKKTDRIKFEATVEPAYFRRRTDNTSRSVQVGRDELVVTQLRTETNEYPGFSKLLADFENYLQQYDDILKPSAIDDIEVHYVDLVVVPDAATENFEITDFLIIGPELPQEPFGSAFHTSWTMSFICPDVRDISHFSFELLPPDGKDIRFRLDWHYICRKLASGSDESVADRLTIAHNYLNRCFQKVFTPEVWELFEPY